MANKSKMKCNRPVASDRPGKKNMVKACSGGEEKLTPRYWACKYLWKGPGGATTSNPSNRKGKY